MKILIGVFLLILISINVYAADIQICIIIPDDKVQRVKDGFFEVRPIPKIPDPDWIDPEDGTEAPLINQYTSKKWLKLKIRQYIKGVVIQGENRIGHKSVDDNVNNDDVTE